MIFAGIDVNIITHAKAFDAGIEAMGLWAWGMCYAQLHATDGKLPRGAVLAAWGGKRNNALAARLVQAGLWISHEDGSWSIWNYEKKNQSADVIERKKQAARERFNRWKSKQLADEQTRLQRVANAEQTQDATRLQRVATEPQLQLQLQTQLQTPKEDREPSQAPAVEQTPVRRKRASRPLTSCPASDATPEQLKSWCEQWGIPPEDGSLPRFLFWHRDKGKQRRDWRDTWNEWKRREPEFAGFRKPQSVVQSAENRCWKMPEGWE